MAWYKTWSGRKITVHKPHWWRDGALLVDGAVADSKPCNEHFSQFSLCAVAVRDESGTLHQIEVVELLWA